MRNDTGFTLFIENLEEELKRLRRENKGTIKLRINFNNSDYEIDTQLKSNLVFGGIYYLSKNNTPSVKFIDYNVSQSVNNTIIITCCCKNLESGEFELYHPSSLFNTKNKAYENYLTTKHNWF